MKARKRKPCTIPGCTNKGESRGPCQTCMREIKSLGPEHEQRCIENGYLAPKDQPGRPRSSKVREALKVR